MRGGRTWTLGAVALIAGCLAAPASSSAALTVGQLAQTPLTPFCTAGFDLVQPTVTGGNSFIMPATGTLTSWSHVATSGAGQTLEMKVFRPLGGLEYRAVGHDGPRALSENVVNTFPAAVQVKKGDVLGVTATGPSLTGCLVATPGEIHLEAPGDLADNQSTTFLGPPEIPPGYRLNVSAELNPANDFSFSVVNRDKRKGTATLRVNVSNPGDVTLSGNSVKRGGAGGAGAPPPVLVTQAGTIEIVVKARGKAKRKLRDTGKAKVEATVTFTPTGGVARSSSKKLKLKLKKKS